MRKYLSSVLLTLALPLAATNLFNASTASITSWCMPGWQGTAQTNVASYSNGTITVTVPGNCSEQWQCQVKLQTQGIALDATKNYEFSCTMQSNKDVSLVTVKIFDNNPLSDVSSHALTTGSNTVTNSSFAGGDTGNGIIVFDFGYASQGTMVTISNITLQEASSTPTPTPTPSTGDYSLVWNQDFTSSTLPANWNIETNGDGGGNNELQYYCAKGVSMGTDPVEGKHCLILTATKESYNGKGCTSGRVNTLGHTYFTYGKLEARIWFPKTANGLWPAFWMMGNDYSSVGWPACGETDIMEQGHQDAFSAGTQERYFNGASHWGPDWQNHYQYANAITNATSVQDGFHVVTCIWTPEKVSMYVDLDKYPNAQPYYEMNQAASTESNNPGKYFNKPNFIIFNLAVGGNFPGIYNINNITALANGPRKMYVDWVRLYQRGDAGQTFQSTVASEVIEGDATSLSEVESTPKAEKVMINGKLYIRKDGKLFDVAGRCVLGSTM